MENKRLKTGTVIKGKDLKGYILCKVLSENMVMRGFQYKMGMNEDVNQLDVKGSCKKGLHFCIVKDACRYLGYGTRLALVSIPDGEDVYVDDGKFRTHRLYIESMMPLNEVATWEYLYENGMDVTASGSSAVRWAAEKGYLEIVKYLYEHGADISANNDYAVQAASAGNRLEIVKYLHEHGADITADNNFAVKRAAFNGHLEVVRYLHEHGADITAGSNCVVKLAAESGHFEVVKYLCRNGAEITVFNHYCTPIQALGIIIWTWLDGCIMKRKT